MSLIPTLPIEHANETDLPELLNLIAAVGLPQDGFGDSLETILVARNGDKIVGCAALEVYGSSALLRSVVVAPVVQGQGLGQRLVQAALAMAQTQAIQRVYLLTETAADFFPKFGFHTIPRGDVNPAVQQSVEFTGACPASAIVMVKNMA
jgi:amino-acid N-acetyltransferase